MSRRKLAHTVEIDGHKMRSLRKGLRLTQGDLAKRATPLSRGYVSEVESQARTQIGKDLAERIAIALGIGIEELILPPMPPGATVGMSPVQPVRTPNDPPQRRAGFRFGSGFPVGPKTRVDMLRDIQRRTVEIERLVDDLLRSEEQEHQDRSR